MPKRDPQKQAELDAARERILKERQQREERVSDVVPVAHDAPSYDLFEAAPTRREIGKPEADWRVNHGGAMGPFEAPELYSQRRDEEAARLQRAIDDEPRLDFIDRTAIGLYVAGYPQTKIYDHAARLWELRAQWRKGQGL